MDCSQSTMDPKDWQEIQDETNGTQQDKRFDPSYGYEPYWPGGDWVFAEPELEPGQTTTVRPMVCGIECNQLYLSVGKICAHIQGNYRNFTHAGHYPYYGSSLDDQTAGYQTFDTYCEFLDNQCRSKEPNKWLLVHVGECAANQNLVFKPLYNASQIINRMRTYLQEWGQASKMITTSTTPDPTAT